MFTCGPLWGRLLYLIKGRVSSSFMEHFISRQTTTNLWFFSTSGTGNAKCKKKIQIFQFNLSHNYGSPATCMSTCFDRCARYCTCFTDIRPIARVKVSFVICLILHINEIIIDAGSRKRTKELSKK